MTRAEVKLPKLSLTRRQSILDPPPPYRPLAYSSIATFLLWSTDPSMLTISSPCWPSCHQIGWLLSLLLLVKSTVPIYLWPVLKKGFKQSLIIVVLSFLLWHSYFVGTYIVQIDITERWHQGGKVDLHSTKGAFILVIYVFYVLQ
jgi:hypothetical protein